MSATYLDDEYINTPDTLCFSLDSHNIFSVELDSASIPSTFPYRHREILDMLAISQWVILPH